MHFWQPVALYAGTVFLEGSKYMPKIQGLHYT